MEYKLGNVDPNEHRMVNIRVTSRMKTVDILNEVQTKILEAKAQLKVSRRNFIAQRCQMQGLNMSDLDISVDDSGLVTAKTKAGVITDDEDLI